MVEGRISHGVHGRRRQRHRRRRLDHGHAVRRKARNRSRSAQGCLLGANSGVGISLGDNCVVESGLYLTTGTKLTLIDDGVAHGAEGAGTCPASSGLLFRRNSLSGGVEAVPRTGLLGRSEFGAARSVARATARLPASRPGYDILVVVPPPRRTSPARAETGTLNGAAPDGRSTNGAAKAPTRSSTRTRPVPRPAPTAHASTAAASEPPDPCPRHSPQRPRRSRHPVPPPAGLA